MLKKLAFLLPVCVGVLPGCMSTPDLSEATGTEHSDIMIKDVVLRVKCELSNAFDKKVEQRDFRWLAGWTAHADLTLQVNDTAGVSPTGTYTQGLRTVGKVTELFTLGLSANLSGTATRSETVSFTVALDELKAWRKRLDKTEANLPPENRSCYVGSATGVTGDLGLKDWVDSAFYPVEAGQLQAGIHPQPGGGGKASSASGPQKQGKSKSAVSASAEQKLKNVTKWQAEIKDLQRATAQYATAIETSSGKIAQAERDMKATVTDAKQYGAVLAPYLRERYAKVSEIMSVYKKNAATCAHYKTDLDKTAGLAANILAAAGDSGSLPASADIQYDELEELMTSEVGSGHFEKDYGNCSNTLQAQAQNTDALAAALPAQVDPPIDAISHQVSFVVSYGAGISPNWTLVKWKGPGGSANTPLLGANGTRTNTLNLALGPRTGNPSISPDALRLINNQVIRNLGTP
jgi:hypothetical protein